MSSVEPFQMFSEVLVSTAHGEIPTGRRAAHPIQGRNIATSKAIPPTAAIICP